MIGRGHRVVLAALAIMVVVGAGPAPAAAAPNAAALSPTEAVPLEPADGSVSVAIPVGAYEIERTAQGHEIALPGFGRIPLPGTPDLPSRIFAIAIPPAAEVTDVTFDAGGGVELPGTYQISPVPLPRVIGEENPAAYQRDRQACEERFGATYGSDEPFPASPVEFVRAAGYRKYNLADVRVTPFAYHPVSGRLVFYPNLTVHVSYTLPEGFRSDELVVDNLQRTERVAREIVLNYDEAQQWYPKLTAQSRGTGDFVIITLSSLTSSVTALVDWETAKGRNVQVVTTSWIDSNYSGYDLAEKMRNFLIDKYPSGQWGIEDVLLVGGYDDVPMRRTWQDAGYGKPETDFYYAELTKTDNQSWDKNQNHQWGETIGDPIDYYNEVNVGRIPWSTASYVQDICNKSVAYEQNNDPSYKKNILLLGAYFWADTDNAVLMEAKVNQPWMADWTMTRMYEKNGDYWSSYACDYPLLHSNVMNVWPNDTFGFVNWAGHGSPTSSHILGLGAPYFIRANDCLSLNDNYPAIIFADACSNSDTDYGNLGQWMLRDGAVGFVGATKVAYGAGGWTDPSDGSSQSLDYFFTTCVTSGNYTQGQAHQWALRQMYTQGLWYMVKYEMFEWGALWGNPDLGMAAPDLNEPPETPAPPIGPTEGDVGVPCAFDGGADDPDADQVYYMWDWGDDTFSDWLGPYASGETCNASHAWDDPGAYDVRIRAKDEHEAVGDWSNPHTVQMIGTGDLDGDGDVDLDDFALFAQCFGGADNPPAAGCLPGVNADIDSDGDVDLDDFGLFAERFTGAQ